MYFISSDFHFSHKRILEFERRRYDTLWEHDQDIIDMLERKLLSSNVDSNDTFYFLGDFGWPNNEGQAQRLIDIFNITPVHTVAILGNHDSKPFFKQQIEALFNEVHAYPIYISHRVVLSHYPVPTLYNDDRSPVLNVHGHTHSSYIRGENYLCASWAVADYRCISEKAVVNRLAKLPQLDDKFLYEPYAKDYVFVPKHRDDIAYDKFGNLDVETSRQLVAAKRAER